MQQPTMTESPQQREAVLATTFVQRLFQWSAQTPMQSQSHSQEFEDVSLDQRVRESGEW